MSNNNPELVIELQGQPGQIRIELAADRAPGHAKRMRDLARAGFYDGLTWFRVVAEFLAQVGCPLNSGLGRSPEWPPIPAEFSDVIFDRGSVGMARGSTTCSAATQFFICTARCDQLDGKYTNFGRVVDGLHLVDALPKGWPPTAPARIESLRLAPARAQDGPPPGRKWLPSKATKGPRHRPRPSP